MTALKKNIFLLSALLFATSVLADPSVMADIKEHFRLQQAAVTREVQSNREELQAHWDRMKPIKARIEPAVREELAKLADGEVTPFARELLNSVEASDFCCSALYNQIRTYPAETQVAVLEKAFNATPDSLRGSILLTLLSWFPKAPFAEAEIQKWLVDKINGGLPAGAYYFILTDESVNAVTNRAVADMKRFSKAHGNAFQMLSIAFLASRGNNDAVAILDALIKNRDLENNVDTSYAFPAVAMSGNAELIQKLCGIITTDTRTRWHGKDVIPNETSFSHLAACACALTIEGFPSVKYWGSKYDDKKKKRCRTG
jgi:hypothetical protein